MLRLLSVAALALALGVQVGCSEDCDANCDAIGTRVRVDTRDPLRITVCIDDDCRDLEDRRVFEEGVTTGGFYGWPGVGLPDEELHVRVAVRDPSGEVLATFDDNREPEGDADCCGLYAAFEFDGDSIEWRG